VKTLNFV